MKTSRNTKKMKTTIRRRLLEIRKMDYYVHSDKFDSILLMCTIPEKEELKRILSKGGYNELMHVTKEIISREVESFSVKQLRDRAAKLEIKGYWSMSKSELILRILNVQASGKDGGTDVPPLAEEGTGTDPQTSG